ncbi:AraC family transcriptional regulator [Granulicella arctica]|uniref:AraC family transcriptional regulator n=1 Tax=Granulicella arctica TaxID=940613 RepID=UPI0021DF9635|nr:AraC family transcriptional regulator [Granulicella arctica]
MDPFLDLIQLLRPQAALWSRIDAGGRWGVSFRQRDDVLFCWVQSGECHLVSPAMQPLRLSTDDFALVRTSTPFVLASDLAVEPEDSENIVAATGNTAMKLGDDTNFPVILRGGRFVFDSANQELLLGLLPQVVHIASSDPTSRQLRALLSMNEVESRLPGLGSEFVTARLMELIFVEILRSEALRLNPMQTGLLAGMADPVVGLALRAMHAKVAQPWTVASLARYCGISRSGFSQRFNQVVGISPIEYLQRWRIALAKDRLLRTTRSVGEIALSIGFQSASAFSTAFTRAAGCSPKRFAEEALRAGLAAK